MGLAQHWQAVEAEEAAGHVSLGVSTLDCGVILLVSHEPLRPTAQAAEPLAAALQRQRASDQATLA